MELFIAYFVLFTITLISYLILRGNIKTNSQEELSEWKMETFSDITSFAGAISNLKLLVKKPKCASRAIWLAYSILGILYLAAFLLFSVRILGYLLTSNP